METEAGSGQMTDEDLMRRLQGGEDAALGQLMQRWEIPVKRFIFRMVGNTAEAEDVAQEVFVRVYSKRASYRIGAKFSTWCFSIAANQARNRLRWWRRRPATSLDAWTDAGGDNADESRGGESAATHAIRQEQIAAVRSAVAVLPVDLRTSLVLFEYEGLSMAEIAVALKCSPKAVENRLYRARQLLKQVLGPASRDVS
jgi:RNA polymerase sigma-70 factor (ECF subfamily)